MSSSDVAPKKEEEVDDEAMDIASPAISPSAAAADDDDDDAVMKDAADDDTKQLKEATATTEAAEVGLPSNRFELELEFIQALASPNYLHFLATNAVETHDIVTTSPETTSGGAEATTTTTPPPTTVLQDPAFMEFLKYLRDTWSRPEYNRFIQYPHCLYFLDLLIEKQAVVLKEWTLPAFRNFCHQQQFLSWQYRHQVCYGRGTSNDAAPPAAAAAALPSLAAPGDGEQQPPDGAAAAAASGDPAL